jgi:hypothetical protein
MDAATLIDFALSVFGFTTYLSDLDSNEEADPGRTTKPIGG